MNNGLIRKSILLAAPALALAIMPALAQPPSAPPPGEKRERLKEMRDDPVVQKYREEFKEELREHPRIAASLVSLNVTKEHLKNAPHDFGGHRVAALAAVDEAIKQLKEAIKFDVKQEEKHEGPHKGADAPKK